MTMVSMVSFVACQYFPEVIQTDASLVPTPSSVPGNEAKTDALLPLRPPQKKFLKCFVYIILSAQMQRRLLNNNLQFAVFTINTNNLY